MKMILLACAASAAYLSVSVPEPGRTVSVEKTAVLSAGGVVGSVRIEASNAVVTVAGVGEVRAEGIERGPDGRVSAYHVDGQRIAPYRVSRSR